MEPAQVAMLQGLLRTESRSLLQYAAEAYPWSKAGEQGACDAIRAMARAEADAVAKLGRWLAKQRVPLTFPGAFPISFTTSNFIAARAFVPRLIVDAQQHIAAVEKTCAALTPDDGRALAQSFLELKKSHLLKLSALQTPA